MSIFKHEGWKAVFTNSDTEKVFPTREKAIEAAEAYVGNRLVAVIFGGTDDERYLYGPGNGDTSVMVMKTYTGWADKEKANG